MHHAALDSCGPLHPRQDLLGALLQRVHRLRLPATWLLLYVRLFWSFPFRLGGTRAEDVPDGLGGLVLVADQLDVGPDLNKTLQ